MEELVEVLKLYVDDTPRILRQVVAGAIAIYMAAYFLDKVIVIFQKDSFKSVLSVLSKSGVGAYSRLRNDIGSSFVSPIRRPRLSFIVAVLKLFFNALGFVSFSYLVILLVWLTISIPSPENTDGFNPYSMLWPAVFFYFVAKFSMVEMDRSYLVVKGKIRRLAR